MAEGRRLGWKRIVKAGKDLHAVYREYIFIRIKRPASLMRGFDVGARVRRVVAHLLGECPVARVVAGL